ncbi:MAG: 2-C-methyl-D-erythritol 4-phosphate cytidylyltransferase [Pyrinomonadaceae bacterium]|jgi:2-C-methyl-D-erythritol 4-phosphate cytidylyltransferase|nr:2-C-methyl-D-erythritol 4-phosphate cytidylyltransferase [Pyrinomonadaceae bacterium]
MNVAIIVAAGRGTRAGGGEPKQFRALAGVPLIIHTLRQFEACAAIDEIVLVAPAEEASVHVAAARSELKKVTRVVEGGATRTGSVWRGLESLPGGGIEIVAVHDGVRPFVTPEEIARTVRAAAESGAAVLCAPVVDTIKVCEEGRVARTLPRESLRRALTPQCFRYELLRRAYEYARAAGVEATDDAALVEMLGAQIAVVEGDARNIKLTRPEDFALAEILLKESEQ